MALPSSGSISLGQVNTELGVSATATRSLNDTTTRALFGVGSGAISLSQGYGKSNEFAFTISTNQTNANLATLATNAGWDGSSKLVATINSGVYISSNATGTAAMTISNSFPGGVSLINNGFIVGRGGNAGGGCGVYMRIVGLYAYYPTATGGGAGAAGGLALSVSTATSVTNNGTIAGGGGGGGGGRAGQVNQGDSGYVFCGGGGGGGGRTSNGGNSSGGGGGSASGATKNYSGSAGGTGTISSQGGGGAGGSGLGGNGQPSTAAPGGAGGGWGAAGSTGSASLFSLQSVGGPFAGGAGGAATSGGANITWVATGTRLGSLG